MFIEEPYRNTLKSRANIYSSEFTGLLQTSDIDGNPLDSHRRTMLMDVSSGFQMQAALHMNGFLVRERSYCHYIWIDNRGFLRSRITANDFIKPHMQALLNHPYSNNPASTVHSNRIKYWFKKQASHLPPAVISDEQRLICKQTLTFAYDYSKAAPLQGTVLGRMLSHDRVEISDGMQDDMATSKQIQTDASCMIEWITYISKSTLRTDRFAKLVTSRGIPLTVLGVGHRWRRQWGMRMRSLHDYLSTVPPERLIIWSDADDVMFLPGFTIDDLVSRFHKLVSSRNGPLIFFAGEQACYPRQDWHSLYPFPENIIVNGTESEKHSPFRYLNAGLMMGQAGHIVEMIRHVYNGDCADDQLEFTKAFLRPLVWWRDHHDDYQYAFSSPRAYPNDPDAILMDYRRGIPSTALPLIGLDYWNELFGALYDVQIQDLDVSIPKGSVVIKATGGSPAVLHQNGNKYANSVVEELAVKFGMPFDFTEKGRSERWE
eukprot:jgi/Hompol1/5518/HPOL_004502-RA